MSQSKKSGFTLIELLVVISIIALLLGILVPVLGAAKKNANVMKEGANLRNIHAALVTYGTANKDFFPGLTSAGRYQGWDTSSATGATDGTASPFIGKFYAALTNAETSTTAVANSIAGTSDYAQAVIMDEGATTGVQWISTGETNVQGANTLANALDTAPFIPAKPPVDGSTPTTSTNDTGLVDYHNDSYAVLAYGATLLKAEWKSNQNYNAIVLGTRLMGNGSDGAFDTSLTESFNTVWTDYQSGQFRGSLVRGDSSSTVENFKRAAVRETFGTLKYGALSGTYKKVTDGDNFIGPYGPVSNGTVGTITYSTGTSGASGEFGAAAATGVIQNSQIGSVNN